MKECWIILSYSFHRLSVEFEWVCWHIFGGGGEFVSEWWVYENCCMCLLWVWVHLSSWNLCFWAHFLFSKSLSFMSSSHFKSSSNCFALWVLLQLLMVCFCSAICSFLLFAFITVIISFTFVTLSLSFYSFYTHFYVCNVGTALRFVFILSS